MRFFAGTAFVMLVMSFAAGQGMLHAQKTVPVSQAPGCSIVQHSRKLQWIPVKNPVGLGLPKQHGQAKLPSVYEVYRVDAASLRAFMKAIGKKDNDIMLPLPEREGGCTRFRTSPSGTMSPGLAARFPDIISLKGYGLADKGLSLRLDYDGQALHAEMIRNGVSYIIAPWKKGKRIYYLLYNKEHSGTERKPITER